jgi:hypothetical protein
MDDFQSAADDHAVPRVCSIACIVPVELEVGGETTYQHIGLNQLTSLLPATSLATGKSPNPPAPPVFGLAAHYVFSAHLLDKTPHSAADTIASC